MPDFGAKNQLQILKEQHSKEFKLPKKRTMVPLITIMIFMCLIMIQIRLFFLKERRKVGFLFFGGSSLFVISQIPIQSLMTKTSPDFLPTHSKGDYQKYKTPNISDKHL